MVVRDEARRLAHALAEEAAFAAPGEVLQVLVMLGDENPAVRQAAADAVSRWPGEAAREWEAFVWRALEVAELARDDEP